MQCAVGYCFGPLFRRKMQSPTGFHSQLGLNQQVFKILQVSGILSEVKEEPRECNQREK